MQNVQPKIFGVLNLTPDSFSDGGDFLSPEKALQQVEKLFLQGADYIDIGGESTAPWVEKISADEEWDRVEKILVEIFSDRKKDPAYCSSSISLEKFRDDECSIREKISLDSYKAQIWEKFFLLGGKIVNDVSGLCRDTQEKILLLKKFSDTKIILMFSRDISFPDPENFEEKIMDEILNFFEEKIEYLEKNGIEKSRIILDPGMGGFLSKNPEISFVVLKNISLLKEFGCKILVGTSRKSLLRKISHPTNPKKRTIASVVSSLLAIQNGADYVRVHDVAEMREGICAFGLGAR